MRDGDGFAGRDAEGGGAPGERIGCGGVSADERATGGDGNRGARSRTSEANMSPWPSQSWWWSGNAISRGNVELEVCAEPRRIPFCSMAATGARGVSALGARALVVAGDAWEDDDDEHAGLDLRVTASRGRCRACAILFDGRGGGELWDELSWCGIPTRRFLLEGDEYDTAFFDKGPKFLHYFPDAAILTHVEFDHADIYEDLEAREDGVQAVGEPDAAAGATGGVRRQPENVSECVSKGLLRGGAVWGTASESADWRVSDGLRHEGNRAVGCAGAWSVLGRAFCGTARCRCRASTMR